MELRLLPATLVCMASFSSGNEGEAGDGQLGRLVERASTLEDLVRQSSLIARVRVLAWKELPDGMLVNSSMTYLRPIEVLRGDPGGEVLPVRIGHDQTLSRVSSDVGSDFLIFAERETEAIEVVTTPVDRKRLSEEEYAALREEVLRLSSRWRHRVWLKARKAPNGRLELEVVVKNTGSGRLVFNNDLRVELRGPPGSERLELVDLPNLPALIVESPGGIGRGGVLKASSSLSLDSSEACRATFDLKDLLPQKTGKQKIWLWVKLAGELSEPVELEVDFGERETTRELLRQRSGEEDPGPFRLTWESRLLRLVGGYRLLALSPLLIVLVVLVFSSRRRCGMPPRGNP